MSEANEPLRIAHHGERTDLTLARPAKANALDESLVEALLAAVDTAYTDGTRLLVLSSEGRHFCAGFDFTGFEQATEGELLHRFVRIEQLLQRLYHAPFATAAVAQGRNFGAGADLFVAARIRIAAPDATFRMPGLRFGLQLGTRRLVARIGCDAAHGMLADSRTVDAAEAQRIGLATAVAAPEAWPALLAAELARATALTVDATARLHRATLVDTRDADMADLATSAAAPGLKARIRAFRAGT